MTRFAKWGTFVSALAVAFATFGPVDSADARCRRWRRGGHCHSHHHCGGGCSQGGCHQGGCQTGQYDPNMDPMNAQGGRVQGQPYRVNRMPVEDAIPTLAPNVLNEADTEVRGNPNSPPNQQLRQGAPAPGVNTFRSDTPIPTGDSVRSNDLPAAPNAPKAAPNSSEAPKAGPKSTQGSEDQTPRNPDRDAPTND